MERWADEGIVTTELAAAEAFQAIFERAQLRERYAVSSSLIDRVDGSRSSTDDASVYVLGTQADHGSAVASRRIDGSGGLGRHPDLAIKACGETGWRETGHGTRGTWTVNRGLDSLSTCVALMIE